MPFRFSMFFFFGPPFLLLSVPPKLRVCTPEFEQLKALKHDAWKTIRLPSEPFAVETSTGFHEKFPQILGTFCWAHVFVGNKPRLYRRIHVSNLGKGPPEGDGMRSQEIVCEFSSFLPWMSCWKLGSMVRISGWNNPKEYTPFIGRLYITQFTNHWS